jgi:hypothetical protein
MTHAVNCEDLGEARFTWVDQLSAKRFESDHLDLCALCLTKWRGDRQF